MHRASKETCCTSLSGIVLLLATGNAAADQPCFMDHWTGQASYSVLGNSVALHGDSVLVSEHGKNVVRVYTRNGGSWGESTPLTGSYSFGFALAVSGDRCVITSPNAYKTFVFDWTGVQWSQSAVLQPSSSVAPPVDPHYGHAVAIDGDTIAIGAYNDNPKGTGSGSVFVHRFNGAEWIEEAKLFPSDAKIGFNFGTAVSVDGDRVVGSAPGADAPLWSSGVIYVFEREAGGVWKETAKIPCPKPEWLGQFGAAVLATDDQIWASALKADGPVPDTGIVYAFERDGSGGWALSQEIYGLTTQGGSPVFGASFARDGDLAVIGARADSENGPASGAVFVFRRGTSGIWTQVAKVLAPEPGPGDKFGSAVALNGPLAVIGAEWDEPAGYASGSAYLYAVGPDSNNNGLMDPCECPGDLNKDWIVDQADLGLLLANWGCTGGLGYEPSTKPCPGALTGCCGDLDADGDVDQADLGVMLQNFGNVCP